MAGNYKISGHYDVAPWGFFTTPLLPERLRALWGTEVLPKFVCSDYGLPEGSKLEQLLPKSFTKPKPVSNSSLDFEKGYLAKSLADFDLSIRSRNVLDEAGIGTVGELVVMREDQLLARKNFGRRSLNELRGVLISMGLSFGMDPLRISSTASYHSQSGIRPELRTNENKHAESHIDLSEGSQDEITEIQRNRLLRFVINLVTSRRDEIGELKIMIRVLPPGLSLNSLPWRPRTKNCLAQAGLLENPQELSRMTYGDCLRIPQMGIASVLDFACITEAALTRLDGVTNDQDLPEVSQRLGALLESPWANKVSSQDPRFSDFVVLARETIFDQIDIINREHDGDPFLALELAEVAEDIINRANQLSALPLDVALQDLIARLSKLSGKRLDALVARFGFAGEAPKTLNDAGDIALLTRERLRQLEKRVYDRVPQHTVFMPKLEEALDLLTENAPLNLDAAALLLAERGLTTRPFDARSLLSAAELCRYLPTFEVGQVRGNLWVLSGKTELHQEALSIALHRKVISIALSQAGSSGVSNIGDVLAEVRSRGFDVEEKDVRLFLSSIPQIAFLDDDWFWNRSGISERNRLRNATRKMLSVTSPIDISAIREGLRRHYKYRGTRGLSAWPLVVAPKAILRKFFETHPGFSLDESDYVHSNEDLDYRNELGATEQLLVEVLRSSPACVLDRSSFLNNCLRKGMNANTFSVFLTYSPIISHRGLDVWSLRGVQVDPAAIEAVRSANAERPREKRALDHGWAENGNLWLAFRMPSHLEAPVLGVPAAALPFLGGRDFKAFDSEGTSCGTIRLSRSVSYGYGPFLRRSGADEDDILIAEFDLSTGEVSMKLENDDYLEALSPSI